jgi:hypothetical protein
VIWAAIASQVAERPSQRLHQTGRMRAVWWVPSQPTCSKVWAVVPVITARTTAIITPVAISIFL